MSKADDLLRQAIANTRAGLQEQPDIVVAECIDVEYSEISREPLRGTFSAASGDLTTTVPIAGHRIGKGGVAELASIGGAGASTFRIHTVLTSGAGVAAPAATVALSTPTIESVETVFKINFVTGQHESKALVTVRRIPEHFSRKPIRYEATLKTSAGEEIPGSPRSSLSQAVVAGELAANLTSGETTSFDVNVATIEGEALESRFPLQNGIVRIGDEEIFYERFNTTSRTFSTLTRGYNGTTPAQHDPGDLVLCLSSLVASPTLIPNENYLATVQAVAEDGRRSTESLEFAFQAEVDVTAPSWTGGAASITPNLGLTPGRIVVGWPPADVDATDLAHYYVDISSDGGATWLSDTGDEKDAGSGPSFIHIVGNTIARKYRVAAEDTSGNRSAWTGVATASWLTPGWTSDAAQNLQVEPNPYKFVVTWDAANSNATFLGHYEVRHSDDGATWTTVDVGLATSYVLQTEPGDTRFFQVRAVDWAGGKTSIWRPTTPVTALAQELGFTDYLNDPSFESGTSEWDAIGGAPLTRSTAQAHDGDYSLDVSVAAGRVEDSWVTDAASYYPLPATRRVTATMRFYIANTGGVTGPMAWVRFLFYDDTDSIVLTSPTKYSYLDSQQTGEWVALSLKEEAPEGATQVQLRVTVQAGTGGSTVYLDTVRFGYEHGTFSELLYREQAMDVMGHFLGLPALRGFWPIAASDALTVKDVSGHTHALSNLNGADFGSNGLVPYVILDGSTQRLHHADTADLDMDGDSFTLGGWYWFDQPAGSLEYLMAKDDAASSDRSYASRRSPNSTGTINVMVSSDGTNIISLTSTSGTARGVWYFVIERFTKGAELAVFLNDEKTVRTTSIPTTLYNSNTDFTVGSSGQPGSYLDGRAALQFICATDLTDEQILTLYEKSRHLFGV